MNDGHVPSPVPRKVLTPGVVLLLTLVITGFGVAVYRFLFGLASVTNLDQSHPWGLWIAIDVSTGVALAAGGFTTAALIHIFHRHRFHAVARPALLTAMLGYTFVGIGLLVDLGRYYNIWHPAWPTMWQGNSVLFEVGMCVMVYLTVLYIEFLPVVCERFIGDPRRPRLGRCCAKVNRAVERTMFLFIIAGVVLSCLHQSSLGNLMVIAPTKVHPLWYTPILPLLFLLSAIAVGFPMVIFESTYSAWSLRIRPETKLLGTLARYAPLLLGLYLVFKVGDLLVRDAYVYLAEPSWASLLFGIEVLLGVAAPMVMFLSRPVRRSPKWLFVASCLVVAGVALNRYNVFIVAYRPAYATTGYVPAWGEIAVTIGLISLLVILYRLIVTYLPVISSPKLATDG